MTAVGALFVIVGALLSVGLAVWLRSRFCVLLFVYHLGASFVYCSYSLTNGGDAQAYYDYAAYFDGFELGTNFVEWMTASIRDAFQASYLDLFMLYHLFGYVGIVIFFQLCRSALDALEQPDRTVRSLLYAVCLLPGMHFWTSAIGKDGLVFIGILCVMWSAVDPTRRFPALILGLGVSALIRPHIAALLAASGALSAAFSRSVPVFWRVLLFGMLLGGVVLALPFLQHFVGLETLDRVGVENGIEVRQVSNLDGGSSLDISHYSLPLQVFTYLYRPLFDAPGAFGLVVSLENIFLLTISLLFAAFIPRILRAGPKAFYLRFNFIFWSAATLTLAATTANLGIASRQKTMVMPSLILLLLTGFAARRSAHDPGNTEVPLDAEPLLEVHGASSDESSAEPREFGLG